MEEMFYIQNRAAGYLGNAIMFWALGRGGYTADLNKSEIFSEQEARAICLNDPEKNKAWPVDYINGLEKGRMTVVDHQYLDSSKIQQFTQ